MPNILYFCSVRGGYCYVYTTINPTLVNKMILININCYKIQPIRLVLEISWFNSLMELKISGIGASKSLEQMPSWLCLLHSARLGPVPSITPLYKYVIKKKCGQDATNVGDEGGFVLNIQEGIEFLETTIAKARYKGKRVQVVGRERLRGNVLEPIKSFMIVDVISNFSINH